MIQVRFLSQLIQVRAKARQRLEKNYASLLTSVEYPVAILWVIKSLAACEAVGRISKRVGSSSKPV